MKNIFRRFIIPMLFIFSIPLIAGNDSNFYNEINTSKHATINPAATITGNFSICLPGPMTTQLTGSGTPAPINPWVSLNPAVATIDNTGLVTAVSFGAATITYTDNLGNIVSENVYVSTFPTITGSSTTCADGILQLDGSFFPHPTSPWASSNTNIATVDNTGLVTGVSGGTVNIIYKNLGGCAASKTITIQPLLSPIITCGTSTDNQITINWLPVVGAAQYGVVYNINGGTFAFGASGNITTFTLTGLSAGDYVDFFVTPSGPIGSCYTTGTVRCNTNANCNGGNMPAAPVLTLTQPTCTIATGSINIIGIAGETFSFDGGPYTTTLVYSGLAANSSHTVKAKNMAGCISTATTVTIGAQQTNTVTLNLTSSPDTTVQSVCRHTPIEPVVYTVGIGATGVDVIGLPSGVSGSFVSGTYTLSGAPAVLGTFHYSVSATGSCGTTTRTGTIIVNQILDYVFCDPSQVTGPNSVFFDWETVPEVTEYGYDYSIGGAPFVSGTTMVSHYEVFGVLPGQEVQFSVTALNMITDCTSLVTTACTNLANENFQPDALQYFPNPVDGLLNISNLKTTSSLEILNTIGQQVYQKNMASEDAQIDMSAFAKGMYIVRITGETKTQSFKVIKN